MRPARRGSSSSARSSATVRIVFMPAAASRSRAAASARVASTSASNSGTQVRRDVLDGGALAGDGGVVAARDRPVSARSGPSAAQFSTVARTSGTSSSRSTPAAAAMPLGGRLERDQEVRGDRRGGVVRGPVGLGDLDRVACRARGRARRRGPARAGWFRRSPRRRRRNRLPSAVTVISGCNENASCGVSASSPVAPEQWPTSGPGSDGAAARRSRVRDAQQHGVGAGAVRPAPERPRDLITGAARKRRRARRRLGPGRRWRGVRARRVRGNPVPVPAFEIPVGGESDDATRSVRE